MGHVRTTIQLTLAIVVITLSMTGGIATTATAQTGEARPGEGGVQQDFDGAVDLSASDEFVPTGEGVSGDGCGESSDLQVQIEDDFVTPVTAGTTFIDPVLDAGVLDAFYFGAASGLTPDTRLFSETGRWFLYNCGGAFYVLPEGGPAASIEGLVQTAIDRLDPPEPPLAITPDHGKHAVRMPSWFAIEPTYWTQERTETVTAGRVQVSATMTPFEIEWDPGNGETLRPCDNPGTVWRRGVPENQNTCSYTYLRSSVNPPDNTWELAGTIRFGITHTTNAPGTYGPWTPVERTATETIQVVEIQAINVPVFPG